MSRQASHFTGSGSLGGARPKASVVDGGRLYIAKFSHDGDEWDVMGWEKTALDLAERAGIPVPNRRLVRIGDQAALLLERFDRAGGAAGGGRLPYLSAMSLVGAHDGDARDYAEVGEAMEPFVRDVPGQLESLVRRVAFSIAVHNVDDHLRNLGYLRDGRGWALSPAFDVNPDPSRSARRATAVFGRTGDDEAQGLLDLAESLGIGRSRAGEIVGDVVRSVGGWRAAARANGCREAEARLFAPVFAQCCERLRRAFAV